MAEPILLEPPLDEKTVRLLHAGQQVLITGPVLTARDAAHIAVAAVNGIDYLLTWNCRHLANAQIIRKVSVICNTRGYSMPVICTPEELMGV